MRCVVHVALAAAMLCAGGCGDSSPAWRGWSSRPASPPVSLPTTAEPASQPAPAPTPAAAPAPAPAPAPTPAPAPAPAANPSRAVMATVNGTPVYMDELTEVLVAGYGMPVAQQLIANELVRQEVARQKVVVTDADVAAEHDATLEGMFGTVSDPNQRHRLLEEMLRRNNVSRGQWELTMRRNAALAALAERRVIVDANDLRDEFARQYGQKRQVRDIQTASLADAQKVLRDLAAGADFKALVTKYSIGTIGSPDEPGLLPPFAAGTPGMPPAVRQAAFAMRKVGEVSDPIQVGTAFHVVQLAAIVEPQDANFEAVKGRLLALVRQRRVRALQQDILRLLLAGAEVRFVHPVLKAQAEKGAAP